MDHSVQMDHSHVLIHWQPLPSMFPVSHSIWHRESDNFSCVQDHEYMWEWSQKTICSAKWWQRPYFYHRKIAVSNDGIIDHGPCHSSITTMWGHQMIAKLVLAINSKFTKWFIATQISRTANIFMGWFFHPIYNWGAIHTPEDPCMPYMVTWIPSIYPIHVSIYTSTMDPMGYNL